MRSYPWYWVIRVLLGFGVLVAFLVGIQNPSISLPVVHNRNYDFVVQATLRSPRGRGVDWVLNRSNDGRRYYVYLFLGHKELRVFETPLGSPAIEPCHTYPLSGGPVTINRIKYVPSRLSVGERGTEATVTLVPMR